MISRLVGTVELKGEKSVVVDVGGVGYRVFMSGETLRKLPEKGGLVKVWTHQYVREDSLELYGFLEYAELDFFQVLIGISGIGPKGGLGILSVASVDTIKKAIAAGDTSYLTRVSGIGRKTAEKIVLELRDKFVSKGISIEAPELQEEADALDALVALGYTPREARETLDRVPRDLEGAERRVKAALKEFGRRKR